MENKNFNINSKKNISPTPIIKFKYEIYKFIKPQKCFQLKKKNHKLISKSNNRIDNRCTSNNCHLILSFNTGSKSSRFSFHSPPLAPI